MQKVTIESLIKETRQAIKSDVAWRMQNVYADLDSAVKSRIIDERLKIRREYLQKLRLMQKSNP